MIFSIRHHNIVIIHTYITIPNFWNGLLLEKKSHKIVNEYFDNWFDSHINSLCCFYSYHI